MIGLICKTVITDSKSKAETALGLLSVNKCANYNSRLCRWLSNADTEHGKDTFYNQAFNTLFNYSTRAYYALKDTLSMSLNVSSRYNQTSANVSGIDARHVDYCCN